MSSGCGPGKRNIKIDVAMPGFSDLAVRSGDGEEADGRGGGESSKK